MAREKSKLRNGDEIASKIVSDFLDLMLYPMFDDFQRVYDKEEQIKGIDVKFTKDGKKYLCDEKASVRWANRKKLKTYAFELSFINRNGNINDGWLLSDKVINNSYMCIWVDYTDSPDKELLKNIREIKDLEIALVDKEKLLNYLKSIGWNKRKLLRKAKRIRENNNENLGDINKNRCCFRISSHLVEKPVNILIPREKIIELSDFHQRFLRKE